MVHKGRRRISRICPLDVMSEQEEPQDAEVNQSDEISRRRGKSGKFCAPINYVFSTVHKPTPLIEV